MISATARHALLALRELADLPPDVYLGAAATAERIGAPRNYLGKLLQSLAREGIVAGQKGQQGGFRLARPAHRITLYQALDPFEHFAGWQQCFLGGGRCKDRGGCSVHARWGQVRDHYLDFLRGTTLADLKDGRTEVLDGGAGI